MALVFGYSELVFVTVQFITKALLIFVVFERALVLIP